ncbi:hypothetical protein AAGG74_04135 [Bacillus mexicanus]|uniref:hypothetical protein n=1 Tax=Bacillus TaxID=1386 RepID=UPI0013896CF8|nr:hypothetical protein BTW01_09420 [Bacillus sp. SKDU12]
MERYYHLCRNHQGRVVRITERGGRVHVGKITRVTRDRVFIAPTGGGPRGFGYGYWGGYWGYGAAYGISLGLITGVALAGLFFW